MLTSALKQHVEVSSNIAFPFITIALQTDTGIAKDTLEQKIKIVTERVENELRAVAGAPAYIIEPAVNKVKTTLNNLSADVNRKTVIIFLAPFIEKVYYLNFFLEEKIIVGEPLKLRDLVATKKTETKYLLLSLHQDKCYMYDGDGDRLRLIVFNSIEHLKSRLNRSKENFVLHVDNVLTHILKSHSVPLIAVGPEPMLSLFEEVAKNSNQITKMICQEGIAENVGLLRQSIKPVVEDWEKLKEKYLLCRLNEAILLKRAEVGIHKVYKAAKDKRGKLLVIEKDFYYSFRFSNSDQLFSSQAVSVNGGLGDDAVEDVIERVLASGGNIEFVTPGVLREYMHIALII